MDSESFALNTPTNGCNDNFVVLQESDLSNFDSMFFNFQSTPSPQQQQFSDLFHSPSPHPQQQPFLHTQSNPTFDNQQAFNQYLLTFLQQLQPQHTTCTNFQMPCLDSFQRSFQHNIMFDPSFNPNGSTMLRLDSEEMFLNEEDVTVNHPNTIFEQFVESKSNMSHAPHNNQNAMEQGLLFQNTFTNESNAIRTPSDLKEEEFFSGFIPEIYNNSDIDVVPKEEVCPSPLSQSSASNSVSNSINNISTNNVNNTSAGPCIKVSDGTSNFSPKEATISSWFNSIAKLPESSIVLKCDPYGFTENIGTCKPRGSSFSVFVNDNIRIDFSFKIPSNLDLYFEQEGTSRSIFELFIEECKFELCSYLDDDDTNSEIVVESSETISNFKKSTDDQIQLSLGTIIKRDTNNRRASRAKTKPSNEEKKGRKKKKNESCASKKVCFLRIIIPSSGFILARSDNLWVRSKTRQEMERKKDRAIAQKRKKEEESKPTENFQEKEYPKKKKKTSKSKKNEQSVNSFTYEQSPMKGSINSASYGIVFNLDSM